MRFSIGLTAAVLACTAPALADPVHITLDGTAYGQTFDGIGATSGGGASSRLLVNYPEPQRSQILDYLFKQNFGASLQQLKVEIGSDGNSGMGAESSHMRTATDENYNRGYEWWIAKEAKKRNPAIKLSALAWNWPRWIGKQNSQAAADYVAKFLLGATRVHGIDFDYVGIWNETKVEDYAYIKMLRKTLDANGLKTKIVADDLVNTWDIIDAMDRDPELRAAVDVISTHYPRFAGGNEGKISNAVAKEKAASWGKPIWSSEDGSWGDDWGVSGPQSAPYAQVLNRNYIQGRLTSTNLWNVATGYYDIMGYVNAGLLRASMPWSGHYTVSSPVWVVAHTTQFAQPGWRYIDSASGLTADGASYVALHKGKDFSVIVETIGATSPQQFDIAVTGGLANGPVHVWRSNAQSQFEQLADIAPVDGRLSFAADPRSVYTLTSTTGQHKGFAGTPLPEKPFPLPYRDDFERYKAGDTNPRYLMEQNGSFETVPCVGRPGQCLRQMVDADPIGWTYWTNMTSVGTPNILGDKRWRDYHLAVDARIEQKGGYAMLVGRVSSAVCDGTFIGYQFRLYDDGRWEWHGDARSALIASGRTTPGLNRWRHLELVLRGNRVTGIIDGKTVFSRSDTRNVAGLGGFGGGWNFVSFDNFSVTPVAAGVPVISSPPRVPASRPPVLAAELAVPVPANQSALLQWNAVPGASGYKLLIGTARDKFDTTVDAGNVLTYRFTTLTNGKTYFFKVVPYNEKGDGPETVQYTVPGGTK